MRSTKLDYLTMIYAVVGKLHGRQRRSNFSLNARVQRNNNNPVTRRVVFVELLFRVIIFFLNRMMYAAGCGMRGEDVSFLEIN